MSELDRLIPPIQMIEEALTGDFHVHGSPAEADCVIGFSFGYRGKPPRIEPGLSNEDLAAVAIAHYAKLPKIFQFEIAMAYEAAGGPKAEGIFRISKHRVEGHYLDTREVAEQAKIEMDRHKWQTAIILAHPNHMPRCDAVCRQLGIKTIVPPHVKGAVEFDLQSAQHQTRSLTAWREYEPEALELYRVKDWI